MNHSTVAHRWANDSYTPKGTLDGSRMFAEQADRAIYSHGRHFCIARLTGNPEFPLLFTYRGYSVSTSKHISEVRRAVHPSDWGRRLECENPADNEASILRTEWAEMLDRLKGLKQFTEKLATLDARIAARAAKGQPASATLTAQRETLAGIIAGMQTGIRDRALQLDSFARAFGINLKTHCGAETAAIARSFLKSDNLMALSATVEKQAEKAARAKAKADKAREKQARAEAIEYLKDWVKDNTVRTRPFYGLPTLLRVRDGEVETSKGASVPVKHALRLYALASKCAESGKGWTSPPEKSFAVGHYSLTSIDSAGNAVIGCHEISFEEMTRVAPAARLATETVPA